MAYKIDYDLKAGIIKISITGRFTPGEAEKMIHEGSQVVKENGCYRILSDYRTATIDLSIFEIYEIVNRFSEIFSAAGMEYYKVRRALIAGDDFDKLSFYETVALNRGHQIAIFTNIDEAMKWLTKG